MTMPESKSALVSRRLRARGYKTSRSGCTTCKVRHVKCDEGQPACQRCTSTGRTCDGYSIPIGPLTGIAPGPLRNETDCRHFDLFSRNTILGLMGFDNGSIFWNYQVLQFSQFSPAVLHAALALGAFHEHLDGDSRGANDGGSYRLSLMQYNKSIAYLRSKQTREATPLVLTCCILFICLENVQGKYDIAVAHLQNGLKILQDWKLNTNTSASEDLAIENLTKVFRRLDMQATIFLDSRQPELNATSTLRTFELHNSIHSNFSSMQEAQNSLEEIELRLFYILTTTAVRHCSAQSHNEMISVRAPLLHGLADRFKEWKEAFDSFSNRESKRLHSKDVRLGVLLALHYESTSLMLETRLQQTPDMKDLSDWESKITRINSLSRSLIKTSIVDSKFAFSADTGVIAPLYYAAMRATSSPVRQQALDILRSVRCREGFWDAEIAARVAEHVSQAKIAGVSGLPVTGSIQDLAEAHCVIACR